jgi:hypothetical protein
MDYILRSDIKQIHLPGRIIQNVVGDNASIYSDKMTVGFGHYSAESGEMEPHCHAEETVYILDAENGLVRYGPEKDKLEKCLSLSAGMILHFPENEWHVFEYSENGYVDILFLYGETTNLRPE